MPETFDRILATNLQRLVKQLLMNPPALLGIRLEVMGATLLLCFAWYSALVLIGSAV
jgi:anaerobic glycerol-3-phosphate dehydrogenase